MTMWKQTAVTSDHMRIAKNIVAVVRELMRPEDVLVVTTCMVAVIATMSTEPIEAVDSAVAMIAQISPQIRGPLVLAVLDALAEQLEQGDA